MPMTLAEVRVAVARLKEYQLLSLPCGCTPYPTADEGFVLLTHDRCSVHKEDEDAPR